MNQLDQNSYKREVLNITVFFFFASILKLAGSPSDRRKKKKTASLLTALVIISIKPLVLSTSESKNKISHLSLLLFPFQLKPEQQRVAKKNSVAIN